MPQSSKRLTSRRDRRQYRLGLLISLAALIPIGYWVRFAGPGLEWLKEMPGVKPAPPQI
ncbi:MAG: hypothetical protein ACFB5Z_11715 [Elainellaceae cyanobacterium]